jgi:hypothetical protein
MRRHVASLALGFALLCASAVAAQQDEDVQKVPVNGVKNPEMKSYRAAWAGLDMFEKQHELAPAVPVLQFRILNNRGHARCAGICGVSLTRQPGADEQTFALRIASDNDSLAVPVSPEGLFTLPRIQAAYDDKAELVLNQKKGSYKISAEVRTPGLPENVRRLGDLRLECKVQVAIFKEEAPFWLLAMVNSILLTTDWCMKEKLADEPVRFGYASPRALLAAALVSGERRQRLPHGQRSFMVPLGERSWPDDALIELEFAPQEGVTGHNTAGASQP